MGFIPGGTPEQVQSAAQEVARIGRIFGNPSVEQGRGGLTIQNGGVGLLMHRTGPLTTADELEHIPGGPFGAFAVLRRRGREVGVVNVSLLGLTAYLGQLLAGQQPPVRQVRAVLRDLGYVQRLLRCAAAPVPATMRDVVLREGDLHITYNRSDLTLPASSGRTVVSYALPGGERYLNYSIFSGRLSGTPLHDVAPGNTAKINVVRDARLALQKAAPEILGLREKAIQMRHQGEPLESLLQFAIAGAGSPRIMQLEGALYRAVS